MRRSLGDHVLGNLMAGLSDYLAPNGEAYIITQFVRRDGAASRSTRSRARGSLTDLSRRNPAQRRVVSRSAERAPLTTRSQANTDRSCFGTPVDSSRLEKEE
jgi:hypothetical protein